MLQGLLAGASMLVLMVAGQAEAAPDRAAPDAAALAARAARLGAKDVQTRPASGGGLVLGGKLAGRQFAIAIPAAWNGEAVAYAHGYSLPGTPVAVAEDPSAASAPLTLQVAYGEGFAAGHIAYDKAGMGVKTGAINTLKLRDFMSALGARRVYAAGSSMGGNIVMALLERYPGRFAGGVAGCGVTDGWESQMGHLYDMRAAYNALTEGTPYALPGNRDVTVSALPMAVPQDAAAKPEQFVQLQSARIAMPVLGLLKAASEQRDGKEARIVRQLAAIGGFAPDPASLVYPLAIAALGTDDLRATFGGQIYGNVGKVYRPVEMTEAEAAAFNQAVQRFSADPAAVAEARRWHQVQGRFRQPLIAFHNRLDPLVPYSQAEALTQIARRTGATVRLAQYTLPDMHEPLPLGGMSGLVHCGFTRGQLASSLKALREWVSEGRRPALDAVK